MSGGAAASPLSGDTGAGQISAVHFILYVADQERARRFYAAALGIEPRLHVPGMTEFALAGGAVLGLMPAAGIAALLGPTLPDPHAAAGQPRAELPARRAPR